MYMRLTLGGGGNKRRRLCLSSERRRMLHWSAACLRNITVNGRLQQLRCCQRKVTREKNTFCMAVIELDHQAASGRKANRSAMKVTEC